MASGTKAKATVNPDKHFGSVVYLLGKIEKIEILFHSSWFEAGKITNIPLVGHKYPHF